MFTERLETLRAQLTELARLSCNYKLNLLGLLRWGLSTISPARQAGSTSIMLLTPFWWPLIKNTKISWTILNLSLSLSLSHLFYLFIYTSNFCFYFFLHIYNQNKLPLQDIHLFNKQYIYKTKYSFDHLLYFLFRKNKPKFSINDLRIVSKNKTDKH